ncbi:unnamed protein product [Musa hybrid cultivar]
MMRDSHTGLPSWMRTGIFLYTGLDSSSSELLFLMMSSSLYSYSTPFSASAIRHRCPNGLAQKSSSTTGFIALFLSLPGTGLVGVEPGDEGDERDVDEAERVAAEVLLVSQLALQQLQDPDELLLGRRLSLALELPQPCPTRDTGGIGVRRTHLLVDEVGPEAGLGAGVGVGGQQRRAVGPRLVDVFDDDEGLAHGLAVVDEDRDLLMHGVGLEQQRALVPQVLLPVLVLHPLLRQRDPAPLPERAHPEVQQHHPLRLHIPHCSISLTRKPFSPSADWR